MMIRNLGPKDAARLGELEKILFPEDSPWDREVFLAEFEQPHTVYLGIGEPAIAYAGIGLMGPRDDLEVEIHTIGVDPAHQRQGYARALMDELMGIADSLNAAVFLEVRTDNDPAIALYQAYGFMCTGVRKKYYEPSGADAYTMQRARKSERT